MACILRSGQEQKITTFRTLLFIFHVAGVEGEGVTEFNLKRCPLSPQPPTALIPLATSSTMRLTKPVFLLIRTRGSGWGRGGGISLL